MAAPANLLNQLTGFTYDAGGNMTDDGRYAYTFNAENQIAAANGTTFLYDGDGQRVQKSDGTTYWGGGSSGALVESDNSGTAKAEYVFFNGKRIARRDLPGGTVKYYFSDNLGSASVVANAAGAALEQYDYAPYGELHWTNGSDSNHYLFTGKERDTESGNDYFGARYYSSSMGRFMSPDEAFADQHPDDPQTWNLYMYARNNPLHNIDPTGRGTASAIAWGIITGAASFAYHSTPIPGAVNAVRSLTRLATNPNAEIARMNAQSAHTRATITNTVKALGSPEGRAGLVKAAGDAWNAQSTSEKAATVTQVVLAAGTVVAGGFAAGAGSAESSTTTLFRAVDPVEAQSITDTGAFLPSPNGTDFKGFFFDSSDAQSFGDRMSTLTGDQYSVVSGTAPTDLVDASPAHSAATEGSGVLINNQDLPQVKPQ